MIAVASAASRFNGFPFDSYAHRAAVARLGFVPTDDAHAKVINYASDIRADGFQYAYDITNAIHGAASGNAVGDIQGDFSWISPEGEHVAVQYLADENGYQPKSDVLPTPPPVPEAILKSLDYIRTHPTYEEQPSKSVAKQYTNPFFQKYAKQLYFKMFGRN